MSVPQTKRKRSENHQRILRRIADIFLATVADTEYSLLAWFSGLPLEAQKELMGYYGESPIRVVHGLIADGADDAKMKFAGYEPVCVADSAKEINIAEVDTAPKITINKNFLLEHEPL